MEKDIYKTSRLLYIAEAALEYFISLLVTGAYLAKVTSTIGISDSLTGILTSFVSLGCGFQLFAIFFIRRKSVKSIVTVANILNQLFFAFIYFVPFLRLTVVEKTILFIAFLLLGHIINNVIYAPKTNWFMSLIDDKKRGSFSASKEIVSLIGGMLFSLLIGKVFDHFEAEENIGGAFIVCGCSIFVLMMLHSATLFFSKERQNNERTDIKIGKFLGELIQDKNLMKVILLSVLWSVAHYASMPFYGSYQVKELGFSMTFVSILSIAYAIVRSLFSKPLGKYADKHSFAKMLNICFLIMLLAFGINIFTVPQNGKVFYTIHYILYAIGMAGINSATINLIYDYVDEDKRTVALALNSSCSGIAGFLTTLIISPLVSNIQNNGNEFLGLSVYAQQVVSIISVILILMLLIYLNFVVLKIKKNTTNP